MVEAEDENKIAQSPEMITVNMEFDDFKFKE